MPPHPSFTSQAHPHICVANKVETHVGDMNPIASTNWLSSGEDALIKIKVQVEKHVGDVSPILSMNSLWENRGEGKEVSLPHNLCCVFYDCCLIWFGKMLVLEKNTLDTKG
jgi:hypothetical protein